MAKLPESKLIKELAELLEETQLSEIEIETDGTRIRVARQFSVQSAPMAMPASPAPASAPAAALAPASESGASSETTTGKHRRRVPSKHQWWAPPIYPPSRAPQLLLMLATRCKKAKLC